MTVSNLNSDHEFPLKPELFARTPKDETKGNWFRFELGLTIYEVLEEAVELDPAAMVKRVRKLVQALEKRHPDFPKKLKGISLTRKIVTNLFQELNEDEHYYLQEELNDAISWQYKGCKTCPDSCNRDPNAPTTKFQDLKDGDDVIFSQRNDTDWFLPGIQDKLISLVDQMAGDVSGRKEGTRVFPVEETVSDVLKPTLKKLRKISRSPKVANPVRMVNPPAVDLYRIAEFLRTIGTNPGQLRLFLSHMNLRDIIEPDLDPEVREYLEILELDLEMGDFHGHGKLMKQFRKRFPDSIHLQYYHIQLNQMLQLGSDHPEILINHMIRDYNAIFTALLDSEKMIPYQFFFEYTSLMHNAGYYASAYLLSLFLLQLSPINFDLLIIAGFGAFQLGLAYQPWLHFAGLYDGPRLIDLLQQFWVYENVESHDSLDDYSWSAERITEIAAEAQSRILITFHCVPEILESKDMLGEGFPFKNYLGVYPYDDDDDEEMW